jgi:hypothetical protein
MLYQLKNGWGYIPIWYGTRRLHVVPPGEIIVISPITDMKIRVVSITDEIQNSIIHEYYVHSSTESKYEARKLAKTQVSIKSINKLLFDKGIYKQMITSVSIEMRRKYKNQSISNFLKDLYLLCKANSDGDKAKEKEIQTHLLSHVSHILIDPTLVTPDFFINHLMRATDDGKSVIINNQLNVPNVRSIINTISTYLKGLSKQLLNSNFEYESYYA